MRAEVIFQNDFVVVFVLYFEYRCIPHHQSSVFAIKKGKTTLFSFSYVETEQLSSNVFSLPPEISFHIGSFLGPQDLAQAQRVCKSWYWAFSCDSLWHSHIGSPHFSMKDCPAKLGVAYQTLLRECWRKGDVDCEDVTKKKPICGVFDLVAPDCSWILTFDQQNYKGVVTLTSWMDGAKKSVNIAAPPGAQKPFAGLVFSDSTVWTLGHEGKIVRWKGVGTDHLDWTLIAGKTPNPHCSNNLHGGTVSKDERWALTFGKGGYVVCWKDPKSETPKGVPIAGASLSFHPHKVEDTTVCDGTFSPDNVWALTVGLGVIVYWRGFLNDNIIGTCLKNSPHGDKGPINGCIASANGNWALTVGGRGRIVWWKRNGDDLTGELVEMEENASHKKNISKIRLSPDGTWALTISSNGKVVFWDLLREPLQGFPLLEGKKNENGCNLIISPKGDWAIANSTLIQPNLQLLEQSIL